MRIRPWRPLLALNALLLIAVLVPVSTPPTVAAAQTLSVDGSDPVASDTTCTPCKTIQGAINLAGPGASITVAPGTYHETLTITQSVSIIGGVPLQAGEQGPTIVDAGGAGSVVTIPDTVPPDVLVNLTSLTLTNGSTPGSGGGIAALGGTLSLSDTTIMNNSATSAGGGIGGGNNAITLTNSSVVNNTATSGPGGGIFSDSTVTLMGSSVMSNTARDYGGGLAAYGAMLVLTSTIAGNMASDGGGLAAYAFGSTLGITNSSLSANRATTKGGAIANLGSLTVSFSTIIANSAPAGGGIFALAGSTAALNATILARNTAPSGPDCAGTGTVTSLGHNLIGDANGCNVVSAAGDLTGSGARPLDPHLGPLADNGGPTWTMAPQPGSPALDAVPLANCAVRTDQRGQPRPDPLYNGACDIGAVEVPAVVPPATPTSTPTATPTRTPTRTPTATPTRTPAPSAALMQPTATMPADMWDTAAPTATMPAGMWDTAASIATPVVCASHPAPPPLSVGIPPHRARVAGSSRAPALSTTLRYVTGGGTLPLAIRTAPHAMDTASLDVVGTQVVIRGTGGHRTRTTRRVVLYHTALRGIADATGRYNPQLHVAYQPNRPVMATLTVQARTTCGTATRRTRLTILPLRITVTPHRLVSGSPLTVMLHTGEKGQVSITLEVNTTRDTVIGYGAQRRHVRRVVVLYRRRVTGTADAQGRFSRRVAIAYQPRTALLVSIGVTVHLPQGTETGRATATLLPRRHH